MSVHYKFKSSLEFDTITFDGLHISVEDLKKAIFLQKRLGKAADFDLQITNAQTKEEFSGDQTLIPKNTSLIIARVPLARQPKKPWHPSEDKLKNQQPTSGGRAHHHGSGRDQDGEQSVADLSRMTGTEEDKINAMMIQSTLDYDPNTYQKIRGAAQTGEVPTNYRCYKCHKPGHWIKNCPMNASGDGHDMKRNTGIPRSFIDAQKEAGDQPPVLAAPAVEQKPQEVPEDLVCNICKDLFTDAVMIPCCGTSFCDECVRTALIESEDNECPDCHERGSSPGSLIPNRFLRNSVNSFKNETGYSKARKAAAAANPPPSHDAQPERSPEPQPAAPSVHHHSQPLLATPEHIAVNRMMDKVHSDSLDNISTDDLDVTGKSTEHSFATTTDDGRVEPNESQHGRHATRAESPESDYEDNITVTVPSARLQSGDLYRDMYPNGRGVHSGRHGSETAQQSHQHGGHMHHHRGANHGHNHEERAGSPHADEKESSASYARQQMHPGAGKEPHHKPMHQQQQQQQQHHHHHGGNSSHQDERRPSGHGGGGGNSSYASGGNNTGGHHSMHPSERHQAEPPYHQLPNSYGHVQTGPSPQHLHLQQQQQQQQHPPRPYEHGGYGHAQAPQQQPIAQSYPPRSYDGGMGRSSQQPQFPPHRGAPPGGHPSAGASGYHTMPSMHHNMRPRLAPPPAGSVASVFQGVAAQIGTGVIEDTLSAFNRIMAEKERRKTDRRDRRGASPPPRRLGGGPGDRRSRSYSRSRTRSPRRLSPIMRKRSRSPANRRRSSRSPATVSSMRRHGGSRSPPMLLQQRKGSRSPAPTMATGLRRSRTRSPTSFNVSQSRSRSNSPGYYRVRSSPLRESIGRGGNRYRDGNGVGSRRPADRRDEFFSNSDMDEFNIAPRDRERSPAYSTGFSSRNSRSGNPSGSTTSFGSRSGRNEPPNDMPRGSSGSRLGSGGTSFARNDRPPLLQPPCAGLLPTPNAAAVVHSQTSQPLVDPYYAPPTAGHNEQLSNNHRFNGPPDASARGGHSPAPPGVGAPRLDHHAYTIGHPRSGGYDQDAGYRSSRYDDAPPGTTEPPPPGFENEAVPSRFSRERDWPHNTATTLPSSMRSMDDPMDLPPLLQHQHRDFGGAHEMPADDLHMHARRHGSPDSPRGGTHRGDGHRDRRGESRSNDHRTAEIGSNRGGDHRRHPSESRHRSVETADKLRVAARRNSRSPPAPTHHRDPIDARRSSRHRDTASKAVSRDRTLDKDKDRRRDGADKRSDRDHDRDRERDRDARKGERDRDTKAHRDHRDSDRSKPERNDSDRIKLDRESNRESDRKVDRDRERDRETERKREKDRAAEREREEKRLREEKRDKEREREREREKEKEKEREREKEKEKEREREREKERKREKELEKDREQRPKKRDDTPEDTEKQHKSKEKKRKRKEEKALEKKKKKERREKEKRDKELRKEQERVRKLVEARMDENVEEHEDGGDHLRHGLEDKTDGESKSENRDEANTDDDEDDDDEEVEVKKTNTSSCVLEDGRIQVTVTTEQQETQSTTPPHYNAQKKEPTALESNDLDELDLYGDIVTETGLDIDFPEPLQPSKLRRKHETSEQIALSDSILDIHANIGDFDHEMDDLDTTVDNLTARERQAISDNHSFPQPSKWELDDESATPGDKLYTASEHSTYGLDENVQVTNEVLKRAENAIFARAINAIRPIEIKKISVDRQKLYTNSDGSPMVDPIPPEHATFQITVPSNSTDDHGRSVEIKTREDRRERTVERSRHDTPVRSIKDRLGGKVDDDRRTPPKKPTPSNAISAPRRDDRDSERSSRDTKPRSSKPTTDAKKSTDDNHVDKRAVSDRDKSTRNRSRERASSRDRSGRRSPNTSVADVQSIDRPRERERERERARERARARERERANEIDKSRRDETNERKERPSLAEPDDGALPVKRDRSRSEDRSHKKDKKLKKDDKVPRSSNVDGVDRKRSNDADTPNGVAKTTTHQRNHDDKVESSRKEVQQLPAVVKRRSRSSASVASSSSSSGSDSSASSSDSGDERRRKKRSKHKKVKRSKRSSSESESGSQKKKKTKRKKSKSKKKKTKK